MKNISPKIVRYLLIFSISSLIATNIIIVYKTVEKNTLLANEAVDDGKRIVVVVPTGEIIIRKEDKSTQKSNEEKTDNKQGIDIPQNTKDSKKGKNLSKIAILFVDVGKNEKTTQAIMSFAPEAKIGIAYSPYSINLKELVKKGTELGFEPYVYAPMETNDYPLSDPGEMGILTFAGNENVKLNMHKILESAEGYKGIIGTIDEKITRSIKKIITVIDMIKKYEIAFIYNERPVNAYIKNEAKSIGLPIINKFVVVDAIPTKKDIDMQLERIADNVRIENQDTLIVVRPFPISILRIRKWIDDLNKKNITISKVSELIE